MVGGGELKENNTEIDIARFKEIQDVMRNYIITEYVHQHHALSKIWADSECTLRVIMCKNPPKDRFSPATFSCAVSYARFGTSVNGGASNLSSGGVGVGFDFETGKYKDFCIRYKRFTPDGKWMFEKHPDTKAVWKELGLPNWGYVRQKINDVCQHISSLDYLGLDIIITENGMKLCEINSHPAIDYEQIMCGPVLSREKIKDFFEYKGLFKYDSRLFLKAYMESQE